MATNVEVANTALSRIGIDQLLESLDDPRPAGVMTSLHLEPTRQQMLEDYDWSFASRVVALALVAGVTIPGYTYVYRYPVNCLKLRQLTDDQGARVIRTFWNELDHQTIQRNPYTVHADPNTDGSRIICTDVQFAYAWYTYNITDPNMMSALFRSAWAWKIASELAIGLRTDANRAQFCYEQYRLDVSRATSQMLNEQALDRPKEPETISGRW